jgi:hypothetical protein
MLTAIVQVDRSVRPIYTDYIRETEFNIPGPKYPEFELTGPREFDVTKLRVWLHSRLDQAYPERSICTRNVFKELQEKNLLRNCLSLADLQAIQARGVDFFKAYLPLDKYLFASKSAFLTGLGRFNVPCIFYNKHENKIALYFVDFYWSWNLKSIILLHAKQ